MTSQLTRLRRKYISRPLMKWYGSVLPRMSATERQALEAGSTWWEAQLFAGKPDWAYFRNLPKPQLTLKEQAFLEGPVEEFCSLFSDWEVEFERHDLPPKAWEFLKRERFFGIIIPEQYGGLGFSNLCHSEVVKKISTRNVSAAVTVMVPNSLGPGELLLQYGTEEEKNTYLPRLARGEDIPCFALTGIESGSDAAAMSDTGVVCEGDWNGERVLGLKLNWEKRYITLAPVATLMGLAFRLRDPDKLLGGEVERGITVALIPTNLPGIDIGHRHYPAHLSFQNGPTRGHDVFVPLSHILGGKEQIGQGWKMLMGALAAGRGISLPSLSTAGAALASRTTGAYARVRQQFGLAVGKFEGVQEALARIAGTAYLIDSARRLTMVGLDMGQHPAIVSAILKYHATERMRHAINDAMDVHGGKAIIDGPKNYLGTVYRSIPVGITVEGANILTRSLIIFGQGAIRCHPYLTKEMDALDIEDKDKALEAFDKALFGHIGYQLSRGWMSFFHNLTFGMFAASPSGGRTAPYYRQLSRASASLAIASEIALAVLGGSLKRRETLSARLGDVLSELYLLSGALKRFEDDGMPAEDKPLLDWCFAAGLHTIDQRLGEVCRNFPSPIWGALMHVLVLPLGRRRRPAKDKLSEACAELLMQDGPTRQRLSDGVYVGTEEDRLAGLEAAFKAVLSTDAIERRMSKARIRDIDKALQAGVISVDEADAVRNTQRLVRRIVEVNEFTKEELTGNGIAHDGSEEPETPTEQRAVGAAS